MKELILLENGVVIGDRIKHQAVEMTYEEMFNIIRELLTGLYKRGGKMESFLVSSKDLFDRKKNPKLSLSVKDILKNKKIPKKFIRKER